MAQKKSLNKMNLCFSVKVYVRFVQLPIRLSHVQKNKMSQQLTCLSHGLYTYDFSLTIFFFYLNVFQFFKLFINNLEMDSNLVECGQRMTQVWFEYLKYNSN